MEYKKPTLKETCALIEKLELSESNLLELLEPIVKYTGQQKYFDAIQALKILRISLYGFSCYIPKALQKIGEDLFNEVEKDLTLEERQKIINALSQRI